METDFRAINAFQKQKKAVNRRILFPLDKILIPLARMKKKKKMEKDILSLRGKAIVKNIKNNA